MRKISYGFLLFLCLLSCAFAEQDKTIVEQNSPVLATAEYKGITLTIIKAELIKAKSQEFTSPKLFPIASDEYLLITLEIKNNSEKAIHYYATDDNSGGRGKLSLEDDTGFKYDKIYNYDNMSGLIYIGQSWLSTLAFQKPAPNVKFLVLSFPKFNIIGNDDPENYMAAMKEGPEFKMTFDRNKITERKAEEAMVDIVDFGKEYKNGDLTMVVTKVQLGQWSQGDEEYLQKYGKKQEKSDKASMVAVSYTFINGSETRKINISYGLAFSLSDEFNNHYQLYDKPKGYVVSEEAITPEHFPSLYPKEAYNDTVFFEAPIEQAKYLILDVDASGVGIESSMKLKIPRDLIQ